MPEQVKSNEEQAQDVKVEQAKAPAKPKAPAKANPLTIKNLSGSKYRIMEYVIEIDGTVEIDKKHENDPILKHAITTGQLEIV